MFSRIDTLGVINRVSELFASYLNLIQNFNIFLPLGYRIKYGREGKDTYIARVTTPMGTTVEQVHSATAAVVAAKRAAEKRKLKAKKLREAECEIERLEDKKPVVGSNGDEEDLDDLDDIEKELLRFSSRSDDKEDLDDVEKALLGLGGNETKEELTKGGMND